MCQVPDTRYQVFLSSTFSDLKVEREAVTKQLLRMNCIPAGMELFSASGLPPWDIIRAGIDTTDYFVLIIAGRYGSLKDDKAISYTESEYDYAVKCRIPVLAFIHPQPGDLAHKNVESSPKLAKQLEAFRNKVKAHHTVDIWTTGDDLANRVGTSLMSAFATQPRPGWIRGSDAPSTQDELNVGAQIKPLERNEPNADKRAAEQEALAIIRREVARDPTPPEDKERAHLFMAAQPLSGDSEMLVPFLDGRGWQERLHRFKDEHGSGHGIQEALKAGNSNGFSPDFDTLQSFDRRSGGVALTSYQIDKGRIVRDVGPRGYNSLAELELYEDGGLRLFMSRLSDYLSNPLSTITDTMVPVTFEASAIIYVRRLIGLVVGVTEETGYKGDWALAVAATGLQGVISYVLAHRVGSMSTPYPEDTYEKATIATQLQLTTSPGQVANRLVGRFIRTLGTSEYFAKAFEDGGAKAGAVMPRG